MTAPVLVDVSYRGVQLGHSLLLSELGPHSAYLEHAQPMPVGAELVLTTEEGLAIVATVMRVHEQTQAAERSAGMRLSVRHLEGAEASWWSDRISVDDPVIPDPVAEPVSGDVPAAKPAAEPAASAEPAAAEEQAGEAEAEAGDPVRRTAVMNAVELRELMKEHGVADADDETQASAPAPVEDAPAEKEAPSRGGRRGKKSNGKTEGKESAKRTMVMTAAEIREATGVDPSADADSNGQSEGEGKRKRRRRKKR